eukprot:scaffold47197_cov54-Phaeocystis_antarctica.AAC.1
MTFRIRTLSRSDFKAFTLPRIFSATTACPSTGAPKPAEAEEGLPSGVLSVAPVNARWLSQSGPFGKPQISNWATALQQDQAQDSMAATAAAVVAQRRRHEAAEAAANLAEGKEGTPRARPLSPKKKPKKVEMKPTLPYQQERCAALALRHLDTHNCPLSRWPGIRTIVPSTPQRHAPSRRILTTTAPPHVAPCPHGCSCLLSQTSSSASRRRSTIPILTTCGPIYLRRFCPYLPPPDVHAPRAPSRACPRRFAHPVLTTGPASYPAIPHHSRETCQ